MSTSQRQPRVRQGRCRPPAGFTLVEMLVVIGIVGAVAALLLPAVQSAREASRKTDCQNNLRQIGMAFHGFAQTDKGFPAIMTTMPAPRCWVVDVLPLLEQAPIANAYRPSEPYSSANNVAVLGNPIRVFQCPSSPEMNRLVSIYDSATGTALADKGGATDYYPHGSISSEDLSGAAARCPALYPDRPQHIAGIQDGLSQTILLDEVAMRPAMFINGYRQNQPVANPAAAAWGGSAATHLSMYNTDGTPSRTPLTAPQAVNCNNNAGIYAFHPAGANSLFCDGSVHFLSRSTAARVVVGLATRDGDEIIPADGY